MRRQSGYAALARRLSTDSARSNQGSASSVRSAGRASAAALGWPEMRERCRRTSASRPARCCRSCPLDRSAVSTRLGKSSSARVFSSNTPGTAGSGGGSGDAALAPVRLRVRLGRRWGCTREGPGSSSSEKVGARAAMWRCIHKHGYDGVLHDVWLCCTIAVRCASSCRFEPTEHTLHYGRAGATAVFHISVCCRNMKTGQSGTRTSAP